MVFNTRRDAKRFRNYNREKWCKLFHEKIEYLVIFASLEVFIPYDKNLH